MATTRTHTTQRGAVALITAMIVSILLMITTAGMVSLTVKSMRQSTDSAQSTKAYYAAEGGLEDALLKLRRNPDYKGNCSPSAAPASQTSAASGATTCVKISQSTTAATGHVDRGETDQIDLSAISNVGTVTVEWSRGGIVSKIPNYSSGFPVSGPVAQGKWDTLAPAVMEVGVIEYPTRDFSVSEVKYYQGVIAPLSSVGSDPSRRGSLRVDPLGYSYNASNEGNSANRAYIGNCIQGNEYQCHLPIGSFTPSHRYVLRIRSRYNGADYRITVRDSSGRVTEIPTTMYTIDVTARAGDVFRRAQTSFSTVPESINGLDYVLYSDTDICKNYEFNNGTARGVSCPAP